VAGLSKTGETVGQVRAWRLGGACARTTSDVDDADSIGEEEDGHERA
jgi:hypothetical protein